ncbi:hypothetical protein CPB83DRAFT_904891 [Crepidotus variabilis]|uniref:F-box domain-containing protein n=1 Tax=Crepidotus variabilis TaxID=179855 RepID=A0A9P6EKU0_9AGAR|nr:hypothetical protein CPB83DRAFT_904891 [Crepidotus variabilis]
MGGCQDCGRVDERSRGVDDSILKNCRKSRGRNCYACQKLSAIEDKIERARQVLRSLLTERDGMAATLNEHHDPFANRLPVELVSNIFLHCQPSLPRDRTSNISYNERYLTDAALAPGRVCRNWRTIAQSTQELWSVVCAHITADNCNWAGAFIAEWLERSGSVSLRVQLLIQDDDSDEESNSGTDDHPNNQEVDKEAFFRKAQEAVTPFFRHAHRCEMLDLTMPSAFAQWMSNKLSAQTLGRLQHLKFDVPMPDDDAEVLHFKASPQIITLQNSWFYRQLVNWNQLTHFFAEVLYINDCQELFRQAPSLSFCEISEIEGTIEDDALNPVIGPSLQTLKIRNFGAPFWTHFTLPSLDNLYLLSLYHDSHEDLEQEFAELQHCLRRSGCKLKALTLINDFLVPPGRLFDILALSPTLEFLTLGAAFWMPHEFAVINQVAFPSEPGDSTPNFLSKLKLLSFILDDDDLDWSSTEKFVIAMKSKSLRIVRFQYKSQPSIGYANAKWKGLFVCLTNGAASGLRYIFLDHTGQDLLAKFGPDYHSRALVE